MITDLHKALSNVAPIKGVSIGIRGDKSTWRIDFDPSATSQQQSAAQSILSSFDIDAPNKDEADASTANGMTAIQALRTMTPQQARDWVAANVNSLADAKSLLQTMAAILCILARRL